MQVRSRLVVDFPSQIIIIIINIDNNKEYIVNNNKH
jgi:hypothetical protein